MPGHKAPRHNFSLAVFDWPGSPHSRQWVGWSQQYITMLDWEGKKVCLKNYSTTCMKLYKIDAYGSIHFKVSKRSCDIYIYIYIYIYMCVYTIDFWRGKTFVLWSLFDYTTGRYVKQTNLIIAYNFDPHNYCWWCTLCYQFNSVPFPAVTQLWLHLLTQELFAALRPPQWDLLFGLITDDISIILFFQIKCHNNYSCIWYYWNHSRTSGHILMKTGWTSKLAPIWAILHCFCH